MSAVITTNSLISPLQIVRSAQKSTEAAFNTRAAGPDLLRALAILLVMLVHLPLAATPALLASVKPYGWIGVDLFFVLSGYLIGTQLLAPIGRGSKPDLSVFYIRRSFRILPVFLFVVCVHAFVPVISDAAMQPLWRFLTFTMNFGLDARATGALTEVWSLCVEEHFYLILPMLILLLRGRRAGFWTLWIAVLIVVGGMALRFVIWRDYVGIHLGGKTSDLFVAYLRDIYYPSYLRLDGLLFGVLLAAAKVFKPDLWQRHASSPIITLVSGIAVLALGLWLLTDRGSLASLRLPLIVQPVVGAVAGFPLLALGFTLTLAAVLEFEPILDRYRIPGAGMIATLSYSLYLTHKTVMHLDDVLLGKTRLQGFMGFAVYFASSIAVATIIWLAIERPFLNLRKRFSPSGPGSNWLGDSLRDYQDK